ncbi:MAG: hypothetical protein LUG54_04135 [Clostridiales bacterium]|nr:hypothetical protein [Clostridiales bacterium]
MSTKDIQAMAEKLESAGIEQELIEEITYCVDYERTVTELEARLRGGYQFQEIIMTALATTMNYYDADSALVVSIDMDMMIAKPEFETHKEGVLPVCGTGPMYLNNYPAILKAARAIIQNNSSVPYTDISLFLKKDSKEYQRMEQIGIHSIMAVPYNKRNTGFVAVINPRKYTKHPGHNSLLQVLSYVSVAEVNEMNLMNYQRTSFFEEGRLAPNDVFVKLLNGFELSTKEGTVREEDIKSNQHVLYLTHLLLKKGLPISEADLINDIWDTAHRPDLAEQRLRNINYEVKPKIIHIFPDLNPLLCGKAAYSFNRRYNVITDLDVFGYRIRDIQGKPPGEERVNDYMKLISDFSGVVLPNVDHRSLEQVDQLYEEKLKLAQIECISFMYDLGLYAKMHDFICRITLGRELTSSLAYWDIKSIIGMNRLDMLLFFPAISIHTRHHCEFVWYL